ncbi:MAG TPA: signal peptidase I [Candidatus Dormibacteraeota bacterium]|nr:signal peptidase I [Candidatus Dormibacteraeota bacterium]
MNRRQFGCLLEVIETLVLTIIIFLVIQNFVAQPYKVEQQSMERTLEPGQYVLVDKLTPRFQDYGRGDIIVFYPPDQPHDVPFIKRIIGLPGDRIEFRDGGVYVNGVRLEEPYVYDDQPTEAGALGTTVIVPPDTYFGMGDHRADSTDSRVFGPINKEDVVGRAWLRYWPLTDLAILATPNYAGVPPASVAATLPGAEANGLAGAGLGLIGAAGAAAVVRGRLGARAA